MKGNIDKLKQFTTNRVAVDQILRSGWTALMYAASCGQSKAVDYLVENLASPNFHKELFTRTLDIFPHIILYPLLTVVLFIRTLQH